MKKMPTLAAMTALGIAAGVGIFGFRASYAGLGDPLLGAYYAAIVAFCINRAWRAVEAAQGTKEMGRFAIVAYVVIVAIGIVEFGAWAQRNQRVNERLFLKPYDPPERDEAGPTETEPESPAPTP